MLDIYNIPLYYISFNKNNELENHLKKRGFINVNFFKAIDGRKFNVEDLKNKDLITIRAYNDLVNGREQNSGLSSLGCIGCSMSHYNLWDKCVKNNYPYIIIAENDVNIPQKFTNDDLNDIRNTISQPDGIFVATKNLKTNKNIISLQGLHFYIISNSACKKLIKEAFPIDVQTDHYISHMADKKDIKLYSKPIATQKFHISDVQSSLCIKCILPDNIYFYIALGLLIIGLFVYWFKNRKK
jgi:GR25 family glycosyltransferase involved in LPS biosynthesis